MRHSNYRENYAPEAIYGPAIYGPFKREHPDTVDLVRLWVSGFALGFVVALLIYS